MTPSTPLIRYFKSIHGKVFVIERDGKTEKMFLLHQHRPLGRGLGRPSLEEVCAELGIMYVGEEA